MEPWILDLGLPEHALLAPDPGALRAAYEAAIPPLEQMAARQGFPMGWM